MKTYCVYRHIRLDSKTPFYIGKGTKYRPQSKQRNKHWTRIVDKHGYKIEIVYSNLTEIEALEQEEKLIRLYKSLGYCEANYLMGGRTSGGDNNPMFGKGHKLIGEKNGRYGTVGSMKGRTGNKHPKYGKKESEETRLRKSKGQTKPKKWRYITPAGIFDVRSVAAEANNITIPSLKNRCTSKNYQEYGRELLCCA